MLIFQKKQKTENSLLLMIKNNDQQIYLPMKKKNYVLQINCSSSTDQSKSDIDQLSTVSTPRSSISQMIIQKNEAQEFIDKVRKTLNSTNKVDKYVRLCGSFIKLLRALDENKKKQLSKFYGEILKLRQIIRWNGLYETISEFLDRGNANFYKQNLFDFFFKCFQLYGDLLDRIMFILDLIPNHKYSKFYKRLQKIEANNYFIECCIWTLYHLFTIKTTKNQKQKKLKIAKLIKYVIDTVTSYCKFSMRVMELKPKTIAILNIVSSMIGLFTILY